MKFIEQLFLTIVPNDVTVNQNGRTQREMQIQFLEIYIFLPTSYKRSWNVKTYFWQVEDNLLKHQVEVPFYIQHCNFDIEFAGSVDSIWIYDMIVFHSRIFD